ncbi:MAG: hypothetical protein H6841_02505 [Planctomycetes bacterium]|nr:hypothetical protein [Planctomycetota bacterium]
MLRYLLILFLLAPALFARDVTVLGVATEESTLARLQAQVEPAFVHVEQKTGLADDGPLRLVVVGGASSFGELAARDGVGMHAESVLGYAIPAERRIVLNLSGIRDRQLEPIGVLRHEIAHLVMGSSLRLARPLWFEEGVAQYVESMALNELIEAQGANPWIEFSSLADLDQALREEARSGAAYGEAREVIRLIVSRHGEQKFFKFLQLLERGEGPFETAFEQATGEGMAAFEAAWLEDREARAGRRVAGFFGSNLWWILLGLTALLIPLAFVLIRMRGKSQLDHWEETERLYPGDPSWSYSDDEPQGYTPEDPDAWKKR